MQMSDRLYGRIDTDAERYAAHYAEVQREWERQDARDTLQDKLRTGLYRDPNRHTWVSCSHPPSVILSLSSQANASTGASAALLATVTLVQVVFGFQFKDFALGHSVPDAGLPARTCDFGIGRFAGGDPCDGLG